MSFASYHPALFRLAETICSHKSTPDSCFPENNDQCWCWKRAMGMLDSTGLSSQACQWIVRNRQYIEQEGAK